MTVDEPNSIEATVREVSRQLSGAGMAEPTREARRLVAGVAELPPEALITHADRVLSPDVRLRVSAAAARRAEHEPLSRILGWREFYGRRFTISPAVLDPRPDTEALVDLALDIAVAGGPGQPARILDLGTGSGCILLTLLAEMPWATGTGVDISPAACHVAAENARHLGLTDRVDFVCGDALDVSLGSYDLLVSNPPYIATRDVAGLAPEVREFDPMVALDGGLDGDTFYRRLAPRIVDLVPRGWAAFEVGAGMAPEVLALLTDGVRNRSAQVVESRVRRDLLGHDRCVAVRTLVANRC